MTSGEKIIRDERRELAIIFFIGNRHKINNIKFQKGIESSGPILTIHIIELGIQLAVLKKGVNYENLISKLQASNAKDIEKAMAELNAIALICSNEKNLECLFSRF